MRTAAPTDPQDPHPTRDRRRGRFAAGLAAGLASGLAATLLTPAAASAAPDASTDEVDAEASAEAGGDVVELSIVGVNDFHGRLEASGSVPGAAALACAVEQVRGENPHTLFVSAGDNIGATTFTSFIQQDQPTLDAMSTMDLEVSVLGNHEFDAGAADVDDRVIPEAGFPHIGANIRDADGEHLYEPYHLTEVGGITVGFIGVITEDMPGLVNPAGIEGIEWTSMSEEVDRYAEQLTNGDPEDGEADVVVVLAHDGLPGTDPGSAQGRPFGDLVADPHPAVDAVFSGHTHQSYAHDMDGLQLVQGGEYGEQLSRVDLSVDTSTGEVVEASSETIDLVVDDAPICEPDAEVAGIVDDAVEVADELGSEVVAETTGEVPFRRAENGDGSENRGASSTLGELVADAQLWAVRQTRPEVDFAITNSGGLRADLPSGELTYRDLADVQPFANTLTTVELSGTQVHELFEQQWREDGRFSKHAQSAEVSYTFDPQAEIGQRITEVRIDGEPVDPEGSYEVAMNSYMATGGGGVDVALESGRTLDTGMNDLEAFVSYAQDRGSLDADIERRAVAVTWDGDPEQTYGPGEEISLQVAGLAYSSPEVPAGDVVEVELGGVELGEFPLDTGIVDHQDLRGQAEIVAEVPDGVETADGVAELLLTEPVTGTDVAVPVRVTEDVAEDVAEKEEGPGDRDGTDEDDRTGVVDLNILSINDFHGRLERSGPVAGAAVLACTVEEIRAENPNTLFVSAGDDVGASTFTSFIQDDEPTLEALNLMGLDVAALGNHEFDGGAADVDDRIVPTTDFPHLGANIHDTDGEPLYDPYWITEVDGVRVGFIGVITEDMPSLVSPSGIEGIEWADMSEAANRYAEELTSQDLADVVVVLAHDGIGGTTLEDVEGPFGTLVEEAHPGIDAIISGHTHQEYLLQTDSGMWVTQAGQYGEALGQLELSYDLEAGELVASEASLVRPIDPEDPESARCQGDPEIQQIVDDAVEVADELGAEVIGEVEGEVPFVRATDGDGGQNRSADSTLGGLVADAQAWAARQTAPEVDFALMNPGGLRDDLSLGTITYRELATVQPFANTLVVLELDGAQIREVLEQQWREDGDIRLSGSTELRYTYDPAAPLGERLLEVLIDGVPLEDAETYQVTVNSFLAGGGDGFTAFTEAQSATDTGMTDLVGIMDYVREHTPLAPELARRTVAVTWESDPGAVYTPGDQVALQLGGLAHSHPDVPAGETVQTRLGDVDTGDFPLDLDFVPGGDERGRADVVIEVPDTLETAEPGEAPLVIHEPVTGTELTLQLTVESGVGDDAGPDGSGGSTDGSTDGRTDGGGAVSDPGSDDASDSPRASDDDGAADPGSPEAGEARSPAHEGALASTGASGALWLGLGTLVLLTLGAVLVLRARRGGNG